MILALPTPLSWAPTLIHDVHILTRDCLKAKSSFVSLITINHTFKLLSLEVAC